MDKSKKHSDNNDAGGVGAEDLGCSGKWERHIEASRERAWKASLRSLDLSVDKRELIIDTLKLGESALRTLILSYDQQ